LVGAGRVEKDAGQKLADTAERGLGAVLGGYIKVSAFRVQCIEDGGKLVPGRRNSRQRVTQFTEPEGTVGQLGTADNSYS
jgi:hypothetical protein